MVASFSSNSQTSPGSPTSSTENSGVLGEISHKRINIFGKKISLVKLDGDEFLIGVQIAALLKRETFNMYRSMKIKNILIQRANVEQVDYLCKCNAVRSGTHSVTLIPYRPALLFITDSISKQKKENGNFAEITEFSIEQLAESVLNSSDSSSSHSSLNPRNNTINNTINSTINSTINNSLLNRHHHHLHILPKIRKRKPSNVYRSIKRNELILFTADPFFADLNTPHSTILHQAKQLSLSSPSSPSSPTSFTAPSNPLGASSFAVSKKKQKKNEKNKENSADNFIHSLLFAAGSLDDSSDLSPSPSPSPSPVPSPTNLSPLHSPLPSDNSSLPSPSSSLPSMVSPIILQPASPSPSLPRMNEHIIPDFPKFNLGLFSNSN